MLKYLIKVVSAIFTATVMVKSSIKSLIQFTMTFRAEEIMSVNSKYHINLEPKSR